MAERLLLLTGHFAYPRLVKLMNGLDALPFTWRVLDIGVKVAALMTEAIILRRLPRPLAADRDYLAGPLPRRSRSLSEIGVPVERGPDEIADLPAYLRARRPQGGSVEARDSHFRRDRRCLGAYPWTRSLPARRQCGRAGADVIDLGCLPDTPFPHLEDSVRALKAAGHAVSVDSADADELRTRRGGRRGLSAEPHRRDACTSRESIR